MLVIGQQHAFVHDETIPCEAYGTLPCACQIDQSHYNTITFTHATWKWALICSPKTGIGGQHQSRGKLMFSGPGNNFDRLGRVIFAKVIAKLYSTWNQQQRHCECRV